MISEYLIKRRALKTGLIKPDKKKVVKPIAKRSEKMKGQMKLYKPLAIAFLARPENKLCKIKMAGCTGKATVIHHAGGRVGKKLLDETDWIPACVKCNLTVEIKDLEAREKGFKKSRHEKKDTKDSK